MHPVLAHRGRLSTYLIAWLPLSALISAVLTLSAPLSWDEALAVALPLSALHAFLSLSTWYVCRAFPLHKTGFFRLSGVFMAASVVSSSVWVFVAWLWTILLARSGAFAGLEGRFAEAVPLMICVGILLLLLAISLHYSIIAFEKSREAERRSLELQVLAREAELAALEAQVDPHFLFNGLNSISALTTVDPAGARKMCLLLADFLRKRLNLGGRQTILLAEEVALALAFLEIEKVRFGARLQIRTQIDESSHRCLVPALLLQPLVENAVRHGIASLVEGGAIDIQAGDNGNRLRIAVTNPCEEWQSSHRDGGGLGIQNTRNRLHTRYGRDARFHVLEAPGSFRVEITLPVVTGESTAGERLLEHRSAERRETP